MTSMAAEIAETPLIVERLLTAGRQAFEDVGDRLRHEPPAVIVTGARGSSDHAVAYFKYLVEIFLGVPVASIGPSVASLYGASMQLRRAVLISVSQFGPEPRHRSAAEGCAAGRRALDRGCQRWGLASRERGRCRHRHRRRRGAERGCDQDLCRVGRCSGGDRCGVERRPAARCCPRPDAGDLAARRDAAVGRRAADANRRVLGLYARPRAGPAHCGRGGSQTEGNIGVACGKRSAGPRCCTVRFNCFGPTSRSSPSARRTPLLLPCARRSPGSRRPAGVSSPPLRMRPDPTLATVTSGHWALDPLPMLLSFYRFAEHLSRLRGYDPDHPAHLSKITRTV